MSSEEYICYLCDSNWSKGEFTEHCDLCGGGALEKPCPVCEGKCGAKWKRMVLDSLDSGESHWIMNCGLPPEEFRKKMWQKMEEMSKEQ